MIRVTKIKNKNKKSWLIKYLNNIGVKHFLIFNWLFFDKNNYLQIEKEFNFLNDKSFIKENYGLNLNVIYFDYKYKIRNYKLSKALLMLNKLKYIEIETKEIFDLDLCSLNISIKKNKDILFGFNYKYDDEYDILNFKKIKEGIIIMSKEREQNIIDYISNYLDNYDISLKNYNYFIEEISLNTYNVNFEHIYNGTKITICNVIVNQNNKVFKIGINNGLVL